MIYESSPFTNLKALDPLDAPGVSGDYEYDDVEKRKRRERKLMEEDPFRKLESLGLDSLRKMKVYGDF